MADCLAEEYRKIKRPFPPTPARGEPVRPAPAAGQPGRQPAGHRPAPQGTDRTGGWWRAAGAAGTARGGLLQTTLGDCFKSLRQNRLQRCRRCGGAAAETDAHSGTASMSERLVHTRAGVQDAVQVIPNLINGCATRSDILAH